VASWLEQLEGAGSAILGAVADGAAVRIKDEITQEKPAEGAGNRPEMQYSTDIQQPIDGPGSKQTINGAAGAFSNVWSQYKWWIAGGLGIVGYLAIKGGR
jgi:hypothetical protein